MTPPRSIPRTIPPRAARILLLVLVAVALAPSAALAKNDGIPMKHHDWGRFQPGAWQLARIVTETLDEKGNVSGTTITEKQITLVRVNRRSVTLQIDSIVEVGGKTFEAPRQTVTQGTHGEPAGGAITMKNLGRRTTKIGGKEIPCYVQQYELTDAENEKLIKVYYSADVAPYVLKRESVTKRLRDKQLTYRTSVDVIAVDVPAQILDRKLKTSELKTVRKNGKVSTVTESVHAKEVPGGIVSFTSREINNDGRVLRRSRMEIIDYGFDNAEDWKKSRRGSRRSSRKQRRKT